MPGRGPERGLYLITPDERDGGRLLARTLPLLPFASCLQLRNKVLDAVALRGAGARLRDACAEAGVAFIVNDDPRLARALGADGVHLGEQDGAIAAARALLGADAIIGASCYDDLQRARDLTGRTHDRDRQSRQPSKRHKDAESAPQGPVKMPLEPADPLPLVDAQGH